MLTCVVLEGRNQCRIGVDFGVGACTKIGHLFRLRRACQRRLFDDQSEKIEELRKRIETGNLP
jgi:hypothetical protein